MHFALSNIGVGQKKIELSVTPESWGQETKSCPYKEGGWVSGGGRGVNVYQKVRKRPLTSADNLRKLHSGKSRELKPRTEMCRVELMLAPVVVVQL